MSVCKWVGSRRTGARSAISGYRICRLGWATIELGDHRWKKLPHAYGCAADIPELLRQVAGTTGPKIRYDSELWFML